MADVFELTAEKRVESGKAAARRMRRIEDRVPAIVYGAGKEPQAISLPHKEFMHALSQEAIYSHILTLKIGGQDEQVVLKNLRRHPTKPRVLHVDFLRIKAKEKLTMNVPIHYLGEEEAPGVKQGGVLSKLMTEVEIRCLPADLPESIEIDISTLEMNQSRHLSDLKLPSGVELTTPVDEEHDQPIVSIHEPRVEVEEEVVEEVVEGEEAVAEGEEAKEAKPEEGEESKKEE